MWRSVVDFIRRAFTLWNRLDSLEERLAKLSEAHQELHDVVERLVFEQQRDRETATHEREKLVLQLEVMMLKFERRLPPAKPTKDK